MFDPTIFDNLKVVLEGAIYDLDLQGKITITNRKDQVDLAHMARFYAVTFKIADRFNNVVQAELRLFANIEDLSAELLEQTDKGIGCYLEARFFTTIKDPYTDCDRIEKTLQEVWGDRPTIKQKISCYYQPSSIIKEWENVITLKFERKINENQVEDFPVIIKYMVQSLEKLNELFL